MKHVLTAFALTLLALPAAAQPPGPTSKPVAALDASMAGQPIVAPAGPLRVAISETTVPVGGAIPAHKHPYPRLVNVLAGRVKITNLVTGQVVEAKAGDWMIDPIDQWHEGVVLGDEPLRLMVTDQGPPGAPVTIPMPK